MIKLNRFTLPTHTYRKRSERYIGVKGKSVQSQRHYRIPWVFTVQPTIDVLTVPSLRHGPSALYQITSRRFIAKCPVYPHPPPYKLWNKCFHIYWWRIANRGRLLRLSWVVIINLAVRWRIWIIYIWNLLRWGSWVERHVFTWRIKVLVV